MPEVERALGNLGGLADPRRERRKHGEWGMVGIPGAHTWKCVQIPYLPSLLQPGGGREPEDQASVRSFIHLTSIFCAPRMCDERERSAALI